MTFGASDRPIRVALMARPLRDFPTVTTRLVNGVTEVVATRVLEFDFD